MKINCYFLINVNLKCEHKPVFYMENPRDEAEFSSPREKNPPSQKPTPRVQREEYNPPPQQTYQARNYNNSREKQKVNNKKEEKKKKKGCCSCF